MATKFKTTITIQFESQLHAAEWFREVRAAGQLHPRAGLRKVDALDLKGVDGRDGRLVVTAEESVPDWVVDPIPPLSDELQEFLDAVTRGST